MTESFESTPLIFIAVCALVGLIIGSFLNVVIYRVPKMMQRAWVGDAVDLLDDTDVQAEVGITEAPPSLTEATRYVRARLSALVPIGLVLPRSRCPSCGHQIKAIENIPVVSWLALRGRCSACRQPISKRYPIVEATTGLLFAAAAWKFGFDVHSVAAFIIIGFMVVLTLIDADTMLLPDSLTLSLLWLALLGALTENAFVSLPAAVVGAISGYLVFWLIGTGFRVLRGIDGMGAGDYKLLAALGACFGWTALLPIILIAAGVGSIVGVTLMLMGKANHLTKLPFGVYLAPAGIIMLFFGPELIHAIMPVGF